MTIFTRAYLIAHMLILFPLLTFGALSLHWIVFFVFTQVWHNTYLDNFDELWQKSGHTSVGLVHFVKLMFDILVSLMKNSFIRMINRNAEADIIKKANYFLHRSVIKLKRKNDLTFQNHNCLVDSSTVSAISACLAIVETVDVVDIVEKVGVVEM